MSYTARRKSIYLRTAPLNEILANGSRIDRFIKRRLQMESMHELHYPAQIESDVLIDGHKEEPRFPLFLCLIDVELIILHQQPKQPESANRRRRMNQVE